MNGFFFQEMIATVLHRSELPLLNKLPNPDRRYPKNFRCCIGCDEFHQVRSGS